MAKLLGGTTIEGLLTVDGDIKTDEGDVILDSSTNTIDLGVLPTGSGNGLDADLLDGKHAGAFVLESGDSMSGDLTFSSRPSSIRSDATQHDYDGLRVETKDESGIYLDRIRVTTGASASGSNTAKLSFTEMDEFNFHFGDVDVKDGILQEGGNRVATRAWTDTNADVPNADYADNAGDADTVDGLHANDMSKAQSSASLSSTDTTTDINTASWTSIPWDVQKNIDAPYSHDPTNSPTQITFDEAGTYQVYASVSYDANGNTRINPGIKFAINGTRRNAMGLSGYVRSASGHDEGSNSLMETFSVSAGDTLTVQTYQYGSSGTVTMRSEESKLEISSITTRTVAMSDADTLDGMHAADLVNSAGDTMTGNLKANDSIQVARGGSAMDSNNSIEATDSWLGLDSNSTGNGVLLGYYNASEVRIGNGSTDIQFNDFNWSQDGGDLVLSDTNGVELIRQPPGASTQFLQGADIGPIEAPEDSYSQLINAAITSSSTSGDTVGYTFAVDNQSVVSITGESDGSGGLNGTMLEYGGNEVATRTWVDNNGGASSEELALMYAGI